MITSTNNPLGFRPLSSLLVLTVVIIVSCSKNDGAGQPGSSASLMVTDGSPGPQKYVFKVNGAPVAPEALAFSASIPYTLVSTGDNELSFSQLDSPAVANKIIKKFNPGNSFSVYIANVPQKAEMVVIADDLTPPSDGLARVRFVNMSPEAGSLDLLVNGKPVAALSNTKFEGATSFVPVDPGAPVSFQLRQTGSTDTLISIPPVNVGPKKFYTLWAKGGVKSPSGNTPLALGMINNK